MHLLPLDYGPIFPMQLAKKGDLVSTFSGCLCVSGVETSFDSIICKNLPSRELLFSSRVSRIFIEPDQMSWPYQNVRNVRERKVEFHLKVSDHRITT